MIKILKDLPWNIPFVIFYYFKHRKIFVFDED